MLLPAIVISECAIFGAGPESRDSGLALTRAPE